MCSRCAEHFGAFSIVLDRIKSNVIATLEIFDSSKIVLFFGGTNGIFYHNNKNISIFYKENLILSKTVIKGAPISYYKKKGNKI